MYYYGNSLLKFRLSKYRYQDNCPPGKIAPRLVLGFVSRSGLVLMLGGNQTITPEENCRPVRVRVWVRVSFGVEGQFSSMAIVLESQIYDAKYDGLVLYLI